MPLLMPLVVLVPLLALWDDPAVVSDTELSEFSERDPKDMTPSDP